MPQIKKIVIIGGGIIGLCSAYYLVKEGHEVTVVDASNMDGGASYVNAGYLTPSHFLPLAAPGMVTQGLQWMLSSKSPLYIKPRFEADFLKWSWAFKKSCTTHNVAHAIKAIKDINLWSAQLYTEIKQEAAFNFQLENKGLLMLCKTQKMLDEEMHTAQIATNEGLAVTPLNASQLQKLQPHASINALGAIHYHCDWHTTPNEFMQQMKTFLKAKGVTFIKNAPVVDFKISGKTIQRVCTAQNEIAADYFVLAAGTWSQKLAKKLQISIPLQAGKGYSINTLQETGITIPAILTEAKVAVTPLSAGTRFAGTMELAGINETINTKRVKAIATAVPKYFTKVSLSKTELESAACGLRPVSPDGKPYIGKSAHCTNVIIATGHAMMGWSLGPATGKLVQEILANTKTTIPIAAFNPDRKF